MVDKAKTVDGFADILFNPKSQKKFMEECKAMGIEPSTDGYMTEEQTNEYNDMLKEHSTVMGNITDCPWK